VIMFNLGNTYAEERNYPLSIKSGPRTTRLLEYPVYPGYPEYPEYREYREYLITRTEYPQSRHPPLRCSQVFPKDDRNCAAVCARVPLPRPGRSLRDGMATLASWCSVA
jgi:hypothetical protein